jgi:hypothetical protein
VIELLHRLGGLKQRIFGEPHWPVLGDRRGVSGYLARSWCGMKAIEIARQLNRDSSMVSRFCANYEAFRDSKAEKKIADVIDK